MQSMAAAPNVDALRIALDRWDWAALGLVVPLLSCWWWFSSLGGYPTNDDPFYGRPAQILAEQSRFQVVTQAGELSASSVAHALIGGSLAWVGGFSYRVLFLAVILQLGMGGIALYALVREAGCGRWFALFWASVFLANPLTFAHAFTFMTDAPAMSWGMVALYLFRHGLRGLLTESSWAVWLVAGSLATGIAFWMRQTHVLFVGFPLASLLLLVVRRELAVGRWWWASLASLVPAAAAVVLFESGWLVFGDGLWGDHGRLHVVAPRGIDWRQNVINVYGVGILIGFLTLPILPILVGQLRGLLSSDTHQQLRRWPLIAGVAIGLCWLVPLIATAGRACVTSATGSVIANAHFGPIFLSDFEDPQRWGDMGGVAWPYWIWTLITAAAIVNLGALVSCLLSVFRPAGRRSQSTFSAAVILGLLASAIPIVLVILSVRTGVLDRYWMLLLPVAFAIVPECIQPRSRASGTGHWFSTGLLVAQLSLSIVFARDFLAWNQLRWQQVNAWLDQGWQPEQIDGGRDVNAWFRSAEDYDTLPRPGDDTTWWTGRAELALAIGPRAGWYEIGRLHWQAWATAGREHSIVLLRKEPPP